MTFPVKGCADCYVHVWSAELALGYRAQAAMDHMREHLDEERDRDGA